MEVKVKKHRAYENKYPSVTTIISQLANYGLMEWFKRTNYADIIRESNRGKEIGTDMHNAIQSYIETGSMTVDTSYPDEITTALKSFALFKKDHPELVLKVSEKPLTSLKYSYNGTVDCLTDDMVLDWKCYKSGEEDKPKIYDEAKIQTSAYCHLVNEMEGTNFQKVMIVAISKDKVSYNTYTMEKEEIDGYFKNIFLPLLGIYNFKKEINIIQPSY